MHEFIFSFHCSSTFVNANGLLFDNNLCKNSYHLLVKCVQYQHPWLFNKIWFSVLLLQQKKKLNANYLFCRKRLNAVCVCRKRLCLSRPDFTVLYAMEGDARVKIISFFSYAAYGQRTLPANRPNHGRHGTKLYIMANSLHFWWNLHYRLKFQNWKLEKQFFSGNRLVYYDSCLGVLLFKYLNFFKWMQVPPNVKYSGNCHVVLQQAELKLNVQTSLDVFYWIIYDTHGRLIQ